MKIIILAVVLLSCCVFVVADKLYIATEQASYLVNKANDTVLSFKVECWQNGMLVGRNATFNLVKDEKTVQAGFLEVWSGGFFTFKYDFKDVPEGSYVVKLACLDATKDVPVQVIDRDKLLSVFVDDNNEVNWLRIGEVAGIILFLIIILWLLFGEFGKK